MKRFALVLALVATVAAQSPASKAAPQKSQPATGKAHMTVDVKPANSTPLPTKQEVEAFLARWVGQDPTLKYQVLRISPSEVPNVAHVIVQVGENQPPTDLYITPDGEHAIVGQVIPFGANPFAATRRKLEAQAHGPRTGSQSPKVTIVEFSDLQCPHCKNAQPIVDRLLADTPNAQVVFQPFPLSIHDWASKAAIMGECVAEQNPNAFWNYAKEVFAQQDQITAANAPEKLQGIAAHSGVNVEKAKACAAGPDASRKVQQSIDLGLGLGVSSTPTIFINGRKVLGVSSIPYEQLKKLVDFEAQQK